MISRVALEYHDVAVAAAAVAPQAAAQPTSKDEDELMFCWWCGRMQIFCEEAHGGGTCSLSCKRDTVTGIQHGNKIATMAFPVSRPKV